MRNYYRTLIVGCLFLLGSGVLMQSCRLRKQAKLVNPGAEFRTDRLFVHLYDLNDTSLIIKKFKSKKLRIIDTVDHLKIARMTYDTSSTSYGLIFLQLKKQKAVAKVEFDRNYNID